MGGDGPLAAIASVDLNYVGYAIVALFLLTWLVAHAVWKYGHIEEKWARDTPVG
jgi:nickel/cobalt transporter (NiCoT) family protein